MTKAFETGFNLTRIRENLTLFVKLGREISEQMNSSKEEALDVFKNQNDKFDQGQEVLSQEEAQQSMKKRQAKKRKNKKTQKD